jgi:hypothetical protein
VTSERWSRVKAIVHAALERPPAERRPFVERACAADAALRGEVSSLLAHEDETFLARPARPRLSGVVTEGPAETGRIERMPTVCGGRFLVEAQLGAGAFGDVYRARDLETGATVALKTLKLLHADALYRFKREFRALAELSHPHLVRLYELINHDDEWFFSMEYVDGVDFRTWVEADRDGGGAQRVDETRLRTALRQLALGVSSLHRSGHLHRDLKPSNVMVARGGRVVVLDFGLITDRDSFDLGFSTAIAGTPAYMSPEQAAGRAATDRSDWYGVGAMLYEVLTGRPPNDGKVGLTVGTALPPHPLEVDAGAPADLAELAMRLLARDPARRPAADEILYALGAEPGPPPRGASTELATTFVGRAEELAALARAFDLTQRGLLSVVYVHGTSGIGKTALVERFLAGLRDGVPGAVVLTGRCYAEEHLPFKAFDGLVDNLSRFLARAADPEKFLPRDVQLLARVFPVLRRVRAVTEARRRVSEPPDAQELRRRAFDALRELLARIGSERPLVLFVDDLQWGDAESLSVFQALLRPPDLPPLLLVASYRSEEADVSPLLRALLDPQGAAHGSMAECVRELRLGPLAEGDARRLAELALGGRVGDAAEVARESGGSPFFIGQMAAAFRQRSDPTGRARPTLDAALDARVAALPAGARRVLEVLAVAVRPIERAVALQAAGLSGDQSEVIAALRAGSLIRLGVSESGYRLETYHDRIRENVAGGILSEERRAIHDRIAWTLERLEAGDPEQLLFHFEAAGHRDKAAAYAVRAAEQAAEKLAFGRAATLFRAALGLGHFGPHDERALTVRLADTLVAAGHGGDAAAAYLEAAAGAGREEALELRRRAAEQLLISGHFIEGKKVLAAVLAECGLKLARSRRRALASLIARRAWLRVRGFGFRARPAVDVSAEDLIRVDTSWSASHALTVLDYIHGSEYGARNILLALRAGEPYRIARAVALEVAHVGNVGVQTAARVARVRRLAESLVQASGDPYLSGLMKLANGIVAFCQGRRAEGRDLCDEAVATFREHAPWAWWESSTAHSVATWSRYWLGDHAALASRVPRLLEDARDRGDLYSSTCLASSVANVAWLVRDDIEGARRELARAREQWRAEDFQFQDYWLLEADVLLALYAGDAIGAHRTLESSWRVFESTLLLRVQYIRTEMLHLRAAAALACAVAPGVGQAERAASLATARACVARLDRESRFPAAVGLARLTRAGLAAAAGRADAAIELLAAAEDDLAAASMRILAAAARRRRGALLSGPAGRELAAGAEAAMAAEQIANPGRMTDMLVPGFAS